MEMTSRRAFLAVTAGALSGLAGCSTNSSGGTGGGAMVGIGGGSTGGADWGLLRGNPSNAGRISGPGPAANADRAYTAGFREGIAVGETPIVDDGYVFEFASRANPYDYDPPTFGTYAYKLSADDGSEIWRREVTAFEGTPSGTPTNRILDEQSLYGFWQERRSDGRKVKVASLSRSDGSVEWRRSWNLSERGRLTGEPTIYDGTLYASIGGRVTALDASDGADVWRNENILTSQRTFATGSEGVVVVENRDTGDRPYGVTLLGHGDGTKQWSNDLVYPQYVDPSLVGGTVYVTDGSRQPSNYLGENAPARKIYAFDAASGTEKWTHEYEPDVSVDSPMILGGGTASVAVRGSHVYYALGFPDAVELLGQQATSDRLQEVDKMVYRGPNLFALNRSDGSVAWQTTLGSRAGVYQPMAVDSSHLYALYVGDHMTDEPNEVVVLDRSTGDVVGSFGPIENNWRPFAVADGTLFTHAGNQVRAWR